MIGRDLKSIYLIVTNERKGNQVDGPMVDFYIQVVSINTPLMTCFAIIIAFAQKYDKKMGIGTLISVMFPYTIVFTIAWTIMLIVWMFFGIDLGPGSPIHYTPAE